MEIFPTLTVKPSVKRFVQNVLIDPVHRAVFGSGAILTRTRFTNTPIKYNVSYSLMGNVDKEILEVWERDNIGYGGNRFKWWNITNNEYWVSILLKPINYQVHSRSKGNIWKVDFNVATLYEAIVYIKGDADATSSVSASLSITKNMEGDADAISSASGSLSITKNMEGDIEAISSASGSLTVTPP